MPGVFDCDVTIETMLSEIREQHQSSFRLLRNLVICTTHVSMLHFEAMQRFYGIPKDSRAVEWYALSRSVPGIRQTYSI